MTETAYSPLEMFYRWERETPDKVYLRQPKNLTWSEYNWRDVGDRVRRIASFLKAKNYPEGSRIAIWSANSMDWPIVDLAIQLAGHISVPIYPGQDVDSANYIFNHSEVELVFLGIYGQWQNLHKALKPGMATVAMLGCQNDTDTSLEQIYQDFEPFAESPTPDPESIFTIIYTSGTTGNPKGAMHMHQTPGHVVPGLVKTLKMDNREDCRLFSFLPMSHAAERIVVEMTSLYANASISFSEGLETFGDEIRSVQPTLFFAVPRLWLKFKEGVDAAIPPEAQASLTDEQKAGIARHLGLGEAEFILTGSAPTPKDVQKWFLDMGIILREGYGMTENFIHGSCWGHNDQPKPGSVGQPMDGSVQVRVAESGEIEFKSKGLMTGYYRNPEKTAEVFTEDGFYRTGDSGHIDEEGNLWVTGRISEVFKTSKGKFIVPTRLENMLGRAQQLAQFCVMGHGLDYPILLTTLSEVGKQIEPDTLKTELGTMLDQLNSELPAHERIGQVYVVPEWTIENGMLTPTMKLKRNKIEQTYREQIEANLGGDKINLL